MWVYLGPIQSEAQIPHLTTLLAVPLFPAKGVHEANKPQRLFARSHNKLSGGYTSHYFVTARAWCAITTALQPSTSITRGLNAVPKVEHFFLSKPSHSDPYRLERRSACKYTPPPPLYSKEYSEAFHRHLNHRIQNTNSHLTIMYDQILTVRVSYLLLHSCFPLYGRSNNHEQFLIIIVVENNIVRKKYYKPNLVIN